VRSTTCDTVGEDTTRAAYRRRRDRFREARLRLAIQAGVALVTIGLIAAGAFSIMRTAEHDWAGFAITAATFAFVYPDPAFATAGVRVCSPSWAWAGLCDRLQRRLSALPCLVLGIQ
jgi:hypothetical protein